jgi:hypothetical protein
MLTVTAGRAMGRTGNRVLDTLFHTSADANELRRNYDDHGGEAVCGSWGNCLRRFNEFRKQQQPPPPATPANAAPVGSSQSKPTIKKAGKTIAKTTRKPSRTIAEEARQQAAWKQQYDELYSQATLAVQKAKDEGKLGQEGATYASIAAEYHAKLASDSPHKITRNALSQFFVRKRKAVCPQSDGRSLYRIKSNYKTCSIRTHLALVPKGRAHGQVSWPVWRLRTAVGLQYDL